MLDSTTLSDGKSSSDKDVKIHESLQLKESSKVECSGEKTTRDISDEDNQIIEDNYNETQYFAQELLANIQRNTIESMDRAGYFD